MSCVRPTVPGSLGVRTRQVHVFKALLGAFPSSPGPERRTPAGPSPGQRRTYGLRHQSGKWVSLCCAKKGLMRSCESPGGTGELRAVVSAPTPSASTSDGGWGPSTGRPAACVSEDSRAHPPVSTVLGWSPEGPTRCQLLPCCLLPPCTALGLDSCLNFLRPCRRLAAPGPPPPQTHPRASPVNRRAVPFRLPRRGPPSHHHYDTAPASDLAPSQSTSRASSH